MTEDDDKADKANVGKLLKLPAGKGLGKGLLMRPGAHVHGPGCDHGHGEHAHDHGEHAHGHGEHAHGHDHHGHDHAPGHHHHHHHHHDEHEPSPPAVEKPPGTRPAETGGPALQLELAAVLPGETDDQGRFEKLERALEGHRGITDTHLRADLGHAELCVHYDPQQIAPAQVIEAARAIGAQVARRFRMKTWLVRGMDSHACAGVIEHALDRLPGVLSAKVAYAAERVVLEYDADVMSSRKLEARVRALGYELEIPQPGHACSFHSHGSGLAPRLALPLGIASGVLLAAGFLVGRAALGPAWLPTFLYALSLAAGGAFPTRDALQSLRLLRFDIEMLMVLAAVGAALLGAWMEGAFLLFLFSVGHAFEHRAMDRARRSIEALGRLRPEAARVKRGEAFVEVPVAEVLRGDVVQVRAGDRVPLDGVIRKGETALDQAAVTGESVPVSKSPGDEVFAGTVNQSAAIEIEVTKRSSESLLARVVDMVAEAEAQKSPTQLFTQRLERTFVPIVIVAAIALPAALWAFGTPLKDAVLRGLSLLVAASPCALAISTPAAVLAAVARAAKGGVLFKGGAHLESLGKVSAVAFDKTGTLTKGKPRLLSVVPAEGIAEGELLGAAAAVEALSNHPLAKAIVSGAEARGAPRLTAEGCEAVHGKGLRSRVGGVEVAIGSFALFEGAPPPEAMVAAAAALQERGQTTMLVKRGAAFIGVLGVADEPRPEARETLAALKALGVRRTVMLSGDNLRVAKAVAASLGIDDPRAPLLPDEKVKELKTLAKEHGVAMIGDGTNDAPALAAASVGVAMGGAGSDAALETADIVLMSDDLRRLPFAVRLARKATAVVRQNVFISIGVSVVLMVCAIFGWTRIGQAVVLHEGSTIVVVLNGLRLLLVDDA